MDIALLIKAAILGIVEGLTEFLPISSTGHLILASSLLDFRGENVATFEIAIQTGAMFAVIWEYRKRLLGTLAGILSEPTAQRFALNVLVAFIPAVVLGPVLRVADQGAPVPSGPGRDLVCRRWPDHPVGGGAAPAPLRRARPRGSAPRPCRNGRRHDRARRAEGRAGAVRRPDPRHEPLGLHHHRRHAVRPVAPRRHRVQLLPRDPDADRGRRVFAVEAARRADRRGPAAVRGRASCSRSCPRCCASAG